jgi:diguanylate cyclase (GGDEF)-like protein
MPCWGVWGVWGVRMRVAARAQEFGAPVWRRFLQRERTFAPALPRTRALSIALPIAAAFLIACALTGYAVTRQYDERLQRERSAALHFALGELHELFGDFDRLDEAKLAILQARTGLDGLRIDATAPAEPGRETQSVLDGGGRIVGWLSWAPDRAFIVRMDRLWKIAAGLGLALLLGALVAARRLSRLRALLTRSFARVHKSAERDALTGLPNRSAMLRRLDQSLARADSGAVAFALVDLDNFRDIGDLFGQSGADAVLKNVAERLKTALPADAILGRFEVDEFAVIASSGAARDAGTLADILRAAMSPPILMDQTRRVTAGIGVAQAPEHGNHAQEVARRAGLALRAAKRDGSGMTRRFEPQIEVENSERRFLLRELESAIAEGAFDVRYQPIVTAADAAIVGVEVLLRWTHPSRGIIAPSLFIPLAEQCGLMLELGEFVLRRALADAARWPQLSIAVNLSPMQIRDRNLVDRFRAIMAESGVAASRIMLEVTEGVLIDDPVEALSRLEALRALGVSLALDDFGTGYSSLSYLQKFPFQKLKIDRAFVVSLGAKGNAGEIIQSIVTLGHALGMKVLAEGVETEAQRVLLRLAGCDEMQGYLFARPGPAATIDQMLAAPVPVRPGRRRTQAAAP